MGVKRKPKPKVVVDTIGRLDSACTHSITHLFQNRRICSYCRGALDEVC